MSTGALDPIDRILDRGGDADEVLREVVSALVEGSGCRWAGIELVESDELALGPQAGVSVLDLPVLRTPVQYDHACVAMLLTQGCDDQQFLDRVALLISVYCLVGWDTGGVPWEP